MDDPIQKRLLKKAFSLLSRRAYSRGEIRLKLHKIADEHKVEIVLNRLEHLKLLNDDDYAYNFSFSRIGRQGWGPEKIKNALIHRKVPESVITKTLGKIRAEVGNDYGLADYLNKYCGEKGLPEDPKDLRNLISHLRRRGYHSDSINGAMEHLLP